MPNELAKKISLAHQKRIAAIAISPSSFRNQGKPGTIAAARDFAADIDLKAFSQALRENSYSSFLDRQTNLLCKKVSRFGCKWGTARKGLNIFFRDVCYSRFHFDELGLKREWFPQLELPLDSYTFKGILKDAKSELSLADDALPRIPAIKRLTPDLSETFQKLAERTANERGVLRVDLDLLYWRSDQ